MSLEWSRIKRLFHRHPVAAIETGARNAADPISTDDRHDLFSPQTPHSSVGHNYPGLALGDATREVFAKEIEIALAEKAEADRKYAATQAESQRMLALRAQSLATFHEEWLADLQLALSDETLLVAARQAANLGYLSNGQIDFYLAWRKDNLDICHDRWGELLFENHSSWYGREVALAIPMPFRTAYNKGMIDGVLKDAATKRIRERAQLLKVHGWSIELSESKSFGSRTYWTGSGTGASEDTWFDFIIGGIRVRLVLT